MKIRAIQADDFEQIIEIYERFYSDEFTFPDFKTHFLSAYVIEEDGKILTAGGIRTILESIAITDKDVPIKARRKALYMMLQATMFTSASNQYGQVHAFIQDDTWQRHLIKVGFRPTNGNSLVLET